MRGGGLVRAAGQGIRRAFSLCGVVLLVCLLAGLPAGASEDAAGADVRVTGVEVTGFGLYEEDGLRISKEEGLSAGNDTCPSIRLRHVRTTRHVPDDLLTRFGFGFVVRGEPAGATVPVQVLVEHPVLTDPITGRRSMRQEWTLPACLEVPAYAGWEFSAEWERVPGTWRIALVRAGVTQVEQLFEVVPGGRLPSIDLRYGLGRSEGNGTASLSGTEGAAGNRTASAAEAAQESGAPPAANASLAEAVSAALETANASEARGGADEVQAREADIPAGFPAPAAEEAAPAGKAARVAGTASAGASGPERGRLRPAGRLVSPGTGVAVQVASLVRQADAEKMRLRLLRKGYPAYVRAFRDRSREQIWYAVRLGDFQDAADARRLAGEFRRQERRAALLIFND